MRSFSLAALVLTSILVGALTVLIIGPERLVELVRSAGPWGPIVFVILKASTYTIAPLNGVPLKVVAGTLFGVWDGIIYALLGDVLGGSTNFWLARRFGRAGLSKVAGPAGLQRIDNLLRQLGDWRGLLAGRLVFTAVYDFISYAAGLSSIDYRAYLAITALGGLLPTMLLVYVGSSITDPLEPIPGILMTIALVSIWLIASRWLRTRSSSEGAAEKDHVDQ